MAKSVFQVINIKQDVYIMLLFKKSFLLCLLFIRNLMRKLMKYKKIIDIYIKSNAV